MIPIKEKLDEIKWNKELGLSKDNIFIWYWDNVAGKMIAFSWHDYEKAEASDSFIVIHDAQGEKNIPFHRVLRITHDSEIIWERKKKIEELGAE